METIAALAIEDRRVSCVLGEPGYGRRLPKLLASAVVEESGIRQIPPHDLIPLVPFKRAELVRRKRMVSLPFYPDALDEWKVEASLMALQEVEGILREAPTNILLGTRSANVGDISGAISREGYNLMDPACLAESYAKSILNQADAKRANLIVTCGERWTDVVVLLMGWKAWSKHYPFGVQSLVEEVGDFLEIDGGDAWNALEAATLGLSASCRDATTRAASSVAPRGRGLRLEAQELVLASVARWAFEINNDLRAEAPYLQLSGRPVLQPVSRYLPRGLDRVFARLMNRRLEVRRIKPRRLYVPAADLDCRLNAAIGVLLNAC
ncbi:MAG: hypothetical protein COB53_03700 [Elusimicrobia bacterium]|nr:MAG: hypothetical protein COB53_03700 [Elusimicrobiota bacterium]